MVRAGQRMIGIYLSNDLYEEIKMTANRHNKSMKDYLIDLHKVSLGSSVEAAPSEQYQQLQQQLQTIQQQLNQLTRASTFVTPARTPASPKISPQPQRNVNLLDASDLQSHPLVTKFLQKFSSQPRQRQSLLDTLVVLYAYGGRATTSIIKRERGLSRTTIAQKQIVKLLAYGVVVENTNVHPREVQFTDHWMEQLGLQH